GPMEQRLALALAACEIVRFAVALKLTQVPPYGLPSLDLAGILIRQSPPSIIAAVPLKPTAWVNRGYPTLLAPHGQRLAGVDAEEVQGWVGSVRRKMCTGKPAAGELVAAVGHILAAEHPQPKHLGRCQLRAELRVEFASCRGRELIPIPSLH